LLSRAISHLKTTGQSGIIVQIIFAQRLRKRKRKGKGLAAHSC